MSVTSHVSSWGLVKPPAGARINWGHPLAQGLASVVIGSSPLNVARNTTGTTSGTVTRNNATRVGEALTIDGTSGFLEYDDLPATSALAAPPFTALSFHIGSTGGVVQSFGGSGSNGGGWKMSYGGTTATLTFGGVANYLTSNAWNANVPIVAGVSVNANGGTARFFRDGRFLGSSSVGTAIAAKRQYRIGAAFNGSTLEYFGGSVGYAYLWGRALPDAEIAALYADPYCFMVPR